MFSVNCLKLLTARNHHLLPATNQIYFSTDVGIRRSENEDELQKFDDSTKVTKPKRSLFANRDVPINISYPNKKGVADYNPTYTPEELLQILPETARKQSMLVKEEAKELLSQASLEKTEMLEDLGFLRHKEARVEFSFDTDEKRSLWHLGCDSDWRQGFSSVSLTPTVNGTAMFSGTLSTKIVKDGRVERAGWASMKLEDRAAFNRKKFLARWRNFSHLLIKVRGDGRSYKVMLHSPLAMDFTWGDSFSYPLHTHGGPYWQYEKIPFSKFFHTVAGRIQDRQYPVNLEDVSSIGIVLMDRIDGDFKLEIDYIGVYNDTTHTEEFAYETYTLPVFSTHGF